MLLICDFDGTLAPFSPDIYGVTPHPQAMAALETLASLPDTQVAILSGRHLEGLMRVCPLRDPVMLIGSHGAETHLGQEPENSAGLRAIEEEIQKVSPAIEIETKPFHTVAHVAAVAEQDPAQASELLDRVEALDPHGLRVTRGKNIVEFSATTETKGSWIEKARHRLQPNHTIFIGDDATDEDGFAALGPFDLGIKVGDGDTLATMRLPDIEAVADWLTDLAEQRSSILE